jgi:hypothetical protein
MTWQNLEYNAKKEGHTLDFTKDSFLRFYGFSAARCCSYCGISEQAFNSLKRRNTRGYHVQCLGVDRADSSAGYSPTNARIACLICNRIKSDIFTADEMAVVGRGISTIWSKRGLAC